MLIERSSYPLFLAVDRATRWVFGYVRSIKTDASTTAFLKMLLQACRIRIPKYREMTARNPRQTVHLQEAVSQWRPDARHKTQAEQAEACHQRRDRRLYGRITEWLQSYRYNARRLGVGFGALWGSHDHRLPQSASKSKTPKQVVKGQGEVNAPVFQKGPHGQL